MNKVPINKDEYSESSKRSVGHEFLGEYYENKNYRCSKCHKNTVFTALEQKEAYEVRKDYMWAKRHLCNTCWREMRSIKAELQRIESKYCENKEFALGNKEFMEAWLEKLQIFPTYGRKINSARIEFVKRHLSKW